MACERRSSSSARRLAIDGPELDGTELDGPAFDCSEGVELDIGGRVVLASHTLFAMSTPQLKLGAVHHVSINVADVEATKPFYTEALGLTEIPRPDFGFAGAWLRSPGGAEVHLLEVADWVAPKGQHWSFHVDDIDATVGALRDAGVKVKDPVTIGDTGGRQAFLFDPAGNMIELTQPAG